MDIWRRPRAARRIGGITIVNTIDQTVNVEITLPSISHQIWWSLNLALLQGGRFPRDHKLLRASFDAPLLPPAHSQNPTSLIPFPFVAFLLFNLRSILLEISGSAVTSTHATEPVSPAKIHRLMKRECCSSLKVRFHANSFKISEMLSTEWYFDF